jgi:chitinase
MKRLPRLLAALAVPLVAVGGALVATSQTAAAAIPTHTITGYWQNFVNGATPVRLRDVPPAYGIVAVAFADATGTPGGVAFSLDATLSSQLGGYSAADFRADVAALKAAGRKVVVSVGGQNGAISLPDAAAANTFATGVHGLMQSWGFDGVDIDLENAPNLQNMTSALRQLRQLAGPDLVLTMAPETIYVQPGGSYLQLVDQVRDLVTVVNTQYYNSGSMIGRDGRVYSAGTVDFQTALADILLDGHLRPDQVGLGLPASPSAAGSGYVDPSVVNAALSCLATGTSCGSYRPAAQYPTIRGAMTWSVNWDAASGYRWSNSVGAHLATLPGGSGPTNPPTTPPTTAPPTTNPPTNPPATCAGLAAWSSTEVYWGGAAVAFEGHRWTAKWWTQGDVPGRNGQDVWRDDGPC